MPYNRYITVSKERYDTLSDRFEKFAKQVDDLTREPSKVFDPLSKKQIEELELIRQFSRELILKKNEDLKKAQQAQEVEAKAAQIAAEEIEAKGKRKDEETPTEA